MVRFRCGRAEHFLITFIRIEYMLYWHAIVLGIIEGITEFLPISSTGHLLIASRWLGIEGAFSDTFSIAIQTGAILAVFALTWREWLKPAVWFRVLAGFIPTAIIGFILYRFVKTYLLAHPMSIAISLIVGGIILIAFESWLKQKHYLRPTEMGKANIEGISYPEAVAIGLGQALAVVPGVSRSAATIVTGLSLGISRTTIISYSFLLAVPTLAAAAVYDLWKQRALLTSDHLDLLLVGFLVSAIVAFIVARWLLAYIRRHDFTWFGIYRIAFGLLVVWWLR